MARALILFLGLVLGPFRSACGASTQPSSPIPVSVFKSLRDNAAAMANVELRLTEEQSGQGVESFYGGPTYYEARFASNRFYFRTEMLYPGERKRRVHEDSYDGRIFYYGDTERQSETPAILTKYLPTDFTDPERFTPIYIRYFDSAGFYVPRSVVDLAQFHSIESLVLHDLSLSDATRITKAGDLLQITVHIPDPILLRAHSVNLAKHKKALLKAVQNGRTNVNQPKWVATDIHAMKQMKAMVAKRTVDFFLDPKFKYGVVMRADYTEAGQRIVLIENRRWRYYDSAGVWLPTRIVESHYTARTTLAEFHNPPRLIITFNLTKAAFPHHSDASFALNYKKTGTLVNDRTSAEARERPTHKVVYVVSADEKLLDANANHVFSELHRHRLVAIWVVLNALCVALIAFWLYFRHRRKQSTT